MNEMNGSHLPGESQRDSARLVHIHTFYDEVESDILRSVLYAVGIDTFKIMNEGVGVFGRSSVNLDFIVHREDVLIAKSLLLDLGIDPRPVPMTDPYAHIYAVREGLLGRFFRHPMIQWSIPILLLVGVMSLIASLVNGIPYLISSR